MTQYPPPYPPGSQPQYPPAAPPRKSRRTLFTVLGIVLVVCCLGGVTAGVLGYKAIKGVTAPVRDAAASYLDALKAQDYVTAYGLLCSEITGAVTEDEYASAAPQVTGYKITGTTIDNTNGLQTGTVTARIDEADGSSDTHVLALVKESGDWRVCSDL